MCQNTIEVYAGLKKQALVFRLVPNSFASAQLAVSLREILEVDVSDAVDVLCVASLLSCRQHSPHWHQGEMNDRSGRPVE